MACFVVLVPVGSGFAEEKQKIKQTELHFDLPKKNAEEQCREMDKIYKNILDIQKQYNQDSYNKKHPFWQLHKIGNVYVKSIRSYDYDGYIMLVLDEYGRYIGISSEMLNSKDTYYFGNTNMLHLSVKQKSYPNKIKTHGCYITSINFNYKL